MNLTEQNGWIKLPRNFLDDGVTCADAAHFLVWCVLRAKAAFVERQAMCSGQLIDLLPGQLITSSRSIASLTRLSESTVQRILRDFVQAKRIRRKCYAHCSLITVLSEEAPRQAAQQTPPDNRAAPQYSTDKIRTNRYAPKDSTFSTDASYDLEAYRRTAIGLYD